MPKTHPYQRQAWTLIASARVWLSLSPIWMHLSEVRRTKDMVS